MSHIWLGVLWLHVIAMPFFVGGQMLLAVAVLPVAADARAFLDGGGAERPAIRMRMHRHRAARA